MRVGHRTQVFSFLGLAAVLCAVEVWIIGSVWFPLNAPTLSLAITADLTLGIPTLYYLLVIRPRRSPLLALAPVFVASVVLAHLILPSTHHTYLDYIEIVLPLVEAIVLIVALLKARTVVQHYREVRPATVYATEALQVSLERSFGASPFVAFLVTELTIVYYLVFGWFHSFKSLHATHSVLSYHRQGGYGSVLGLFGFLIALETIGVHLLVQHWNVAVAWVLTALSVYSFAWIIGDYQAARLNPIVLTPERLRIRTGLRWRIDVPWTDIAALGPGRTSKKLSSYVNAALYGEPQFVLHLKEPVVAHGLFGMRKQVSAIGLTVDDKRRFETEVNQRIQA